MNRAFSKILILIIFIVLVGGGIFAWQYFGVSEEKAEAPEEKGEGKIINLADATFEGKAVNQRQALFEKSKDCSDDQFTLLMTKFTSEGLTPEKLTQEEKEAIIQVLTDSKKCIPNLTKKIEKINESVYEVQYIVTPPKECGGKYPKDIIYIAVPYIVEVNLANNSAKTVKGEILAPERETTLKQMEELEQRSSCVLLSHLILGASLDELKMIQ